ncbi:hypothetical protein OIK40_12025 [Erythrobacter sp. sf7]|uniref:Phage protein n=1 Tax=Erythrobacter fulvus TaxID=2987523 RepID=A0ABT5JV11_9SPHN|nr:hypothetical protein [Erythrobacter fulvus]MDC8755367.1 hypothetical protein [Erythrobacter fulvus]
MTKPFYAQRRLKDLKIAIAEARSFFDESIEQQTISFLDDLAENIASRAVEDDDQAHALIVRCMGTIAQHYADDSYDFWGMPNPFRCLEAEPALIPPAPSAKLVEWTWPVINEPPAATNGGPFGGNFRKYSAMKMFGYTVVQKGRADGWTEPVRKRFLNDFMEMNLPPIVKKTFGDEYGNPMSATRLRKVANVIASNASLRARANPTGFEMAIDDWETDLAHLEKKYYHGAGLKFEPWPQVER